MGAVHGHVMHPYDNLDLRFLDLKTIFTQIASGELTSACETFDGQNKFLSVDSSGIPWFARNLSDIKDGKVSVKDIDKRFAGRGAVHTGFRDAALTAAKIFSSWNSGKIDKIFGGNTWYSAEIIHVANPNVIKYDTCALIFHWDGTGSRDPVTGHAISTKAQDDAFKTLTDSLPKRIESEGQTWLIGTSFDANLNKITYEQFSTAATTLDEICVKSGLHHGATLREYIAKSIREDYLDSLGLSPDHTRLVLSRMLDEKDARPAPSITKGMNPRLKSSLRGVMKKRKQVREAYLAPVMETIREVATLALSGTSSNLVSSHEEELARIRNEFDEAVEFARNSNDDRKLKILERNKDQLSNRAQITSSQEGVVFKFDGNTYKLTGKFAPLNQILGLNKDWSK